MSESNVYHILAINAGSSSIKVTVFKVDLRPQRLAELEVKNIGQPAGLFTVKTSANYHTQPLQNIDFRAAIDQVTGWLQKQDFFVASNWLVGHRVVHGGPTYYEPQVIDAKMLAELEKLQTFDPDHLPSQLTLIRHIKTLLPKALHVACFDTGFHHDMPKVSQTLAIPRRYQAQGLRRYGFHGLSYEFLLQELRAMDGEQVANQRLVLAHLGSGASLTAVHQGKSIDTTMSLTPASGIPMSTRSGDIDPGVALYLSTQDKLTADSFNHLINKESGLLGVSGQTADMKELLKMAPHNQAAKEAVELFCHHAKKAIGGLAATLGGIDVLVFTGGIGQDAPKIRAKICHDLDFLGIILDSKRNQAQDKIISSDQSQVLVRVIKTDEAAMIAQHTWQVKDKGGVR